MSDESDSSHRKPPPEEGPQATALALDQWEITQTQTEEEVLLECWTALPFQVPYQEFRTHMLSLKRKHERSRFTQALLWSLDSAWWLSSYAATLLGPTPSRYMLAHLLWVSLKS